MPCRIAPYRIVLLIVSFMAPLSPHTAMADDFQSDFAATPDRVWLGPDYWANPMEDWVVQEGQMRCITPAGNRNVHLLTHELGESGDDFELTATVTRLDKPGANSRAGGSVGFRAGIQYQVDDYRARCLRGQGLEAGLRLDGTLFLGQQTDQLGEVAIENLTLRLTGQREGENFQLRLVAENAAGEALGEVELKNIPAARLVGNIAYVNNHANNGKARFAFHQISASGSRVHEHAERAWGPILWSMHTLSRGVMKMSAQMPPLGNEDSDEVRLEIQVDGEWKEIGREKIDNNARIATFRVPNWNDKVDTPYRLVYETKDTKEKSLRDEWTGTVRRDPVDKTLAVAGFTGHTDTGFPNREVVRNVAVQNPDMLFFSGDQLYEQVGGYGIIREPADRATLNYLRKWYLFGWAFGDLMRDRVSICLPDDHDVYQGNIWGNGGNPISHAEHDAGGYVQPAEMVKAVMATQCAHHPDLVDPEPIQQGIPVAHTDMIYGRVSFAVIMDRMFKPGPRGTVATWEGRPDHVKGPDFDPKSVDKPGLELLGARQMKFLEDWTQDLKGADMKCLLSQTIFINLANYHGPEKMYLVADLDSNGWPQTARDDSLRVIRKGFAFHYAGDQHLPSLIHYGVDNWNDAGYAICVPSIAAGYPRSWLPDMEGVPVKNRVAGPNTGEYVDGLGNKVTVWAIGNPEVENRPGVINTLHDKSSGYAIVRFDKENCTMTAECYRLQIDATNLKPEDQFPGWPKTIANQDNYGRKALAHLPLLKIKGIDRPVIQIYQAEDGEHVYSLRLCEPTFQPKVFAEGKYHIKVGDPDTDRMQTLRDIEASDEPGELEVTF
ncbi:MAG: twin-arginine translocation pathway signal [Pirellulaceae bacterium]